jgi:lipopolysaccharide cholinephosphotransferase
MLIDLETMRKIHNIQLEMMNELTKVMELLNIKYYFVHGSLLGAVIYENFIPEDDDIDIAIFREDYNRLLKYGNDYLSDKYFIQSSLNDDFPLSLAKMRNSRTTFIQPILDKYKCNKGIYIDIFPIDYTSKNKILKLKEKLLSIRINSRLSYTEKISLKSLFIKGISLVFFPSYRKAIKIRESMYSNRSASSYVGLTNGKLSEQYIPLEWFGEGIIKQFSGIDITCPSMYDEYLTTVYGINYHNINPAENRIYSDKLVEINAKILDFEKSYKYYEK